MKSWFLFGCAFVIALAVSIGIALLAYFILTRANQAIADIVAEIQLLFTIITLPTIIIAFWITAGEFRKAQAVPQLELFWSDAPAPYRQLPKDFTDDLPRDPNTLVTYQFRLVVANKSKTIATTYRIRVALDAGVFKFQQRYFSPILGKDELGCWTNFDHSTFLFKNNNSNYLYPEDRIEVGAILILAASIEKHSLHFRVRTSVTTDKTAELSHEQSFHFIYPRPSASE